MGDVAFGLLLVERPVGVDMADEREKVPFGTREFNADGALSDGESTSSHGSVDGLAPDQRKSIINRRAVVRYYSDPATVPKVYDAVPVPSFVQQSLPTPSEETARQTSYDVLLKLDVSRGCGGRIWPAAERLGAYLASRADTLEWKGKSVLELGAGTGLLGLLAARLQLGTEVYVTDTQAMIPLMHENVNLNQGGRDPVHVRELVWGTPLPPDVPRKPDVLLMADCVYLETAFQPLVDTLYELTRPRGDGPVQEILFCYQKRRKADKRFFILLKKKFDTENVTDDDPARADKYRRQGTHLLRLYRRSP